MTPELIVTELVAGVVVGIAQAYPASRAPVDEGAVPTDLPAWRRREALAARGLLRHIVGSLNPCAAAAPIIKDQRGRPSLAGWPALGIGLAHDGDWVAAVASVGRCVGVDVQLPTLPVRDGLLDRCVREGRGSMAAMSEGAKAAEFARIWTVQEACVKAAGTGLAGRPWRIDIPVGVLFGQWGSLSWRSVAGATSVPVSCAWGRAGAINRCVPRGRR